MVSPFLATLFVVAFRVEWWEEKRPLTQGFQESQYRRSQVPQTKGPVQVPMLQKPGTNRLSFLAARSASVTPRPPSEATEIADTDLEVEGDNSSERQSSSRKSAESVSHHSDPYIYEPEVKSKKRCLTSR